MKIPTLYVPIQSSASYTRVMAVQLNGWPVTKDEASEHIKYMEALWRSEGLLTSDEKLVTSPADGPVSWGVDFTKTEKPI